MALASVSHVWLVLVCLPAGGPMPAGDGPAVAGGSPVPVALVPAEPQADSAGGSQSPGAVPVPEPTPDALRYYRSGFAAWWVSVLLSLAVPAVVLLTGFGARIRAAAARVGKHWLATAALFATAYMLLDAVANLPLRFYAGFLRPHQYGLSNQSFGAWLKDWGTELGFLAGFAAILVPGMYLVVRRSPQRWWLYGSLAGTAATFAVVIAYPVLVAPAFDDFAPLADAGLEAEILALADRVGIEGGRVFEVNKSTDTETVNAYVAGFLGSKRIVLWDTILRKLDRGQVLFVMGHEMGHYALGHIWRTMLYAAVLLLAALFAVHRVVGVLIARHRSRFGFSSVGDVASLPLFVLLLTLIGAVTSPLQLAVSRHHEREADRFGIEVTRDNHAAATAWVALQRENLANPRPGWVFTLLRATHPSIAERIEFANAYRPWETGAPLRYESRLR